ncbi:MAG: ABC transporter ATP-binding protein [Leucobacter sp.]
MSIEIRDLTCRYDKNTVVEGLDLEIRKGEFFTLLGPSGCGKTTTLRAIAGFEFPAEGSITISSTDYTYAPPNVRPVNYVFQNYALFPHMSVLKNVSYGLRRKGVAKREAADRAIEELARVRMNSFADRLPSQLSGGQQQRVALARALVNRPDVLLLDEPLSAIDSQLRLQLRSELTKLQRESGITFIFVTHDQIEALSMSDRIGLMGDGKIIQLSSPTEIYQRPNSIATAEFIGNSAIIEGGLREVSDGGWAFVTADQEVVPVSAEVVNRAAKAPGDLGYLTLKPEDIVLRRTDSEDGDGLRAQVVSTQYQGADIAVELAMSGDRRIIVTETRPGAQSDRLPYSQGDHVLIDFVEQERLNLL